MLDGLRDHIDDVVSTGLLARGPFLDLVNKRARYLPRAIVLEMAARLANWVPGAIVEFGVAAGDSTRVLRQISTKRIYALDSFEGLPEKYENAEVGTFAGPIPEIEGVEFIKGYFSETCTEALRARVGRVAFANLDADLYSSTITALHWLTPLLGNGSLLLFDEFIGSDKSEARALADWQRESDVAVRRIAEFDREPSGWGAFPDKRVLLQVVADADEALQLAARTPTYLKRQLALASSLDEKDKIAVAPGEILSAECFDIMGHHFRLSGVSLNGAAPLRTEWYIYRPDWDEHHPPNRS
jgi:predicted O-methyltransferase YrrM